MLMLLWVAQSGSLSGALGWFGFADGPQSFYRGRLRSTNVCHFFSFVTFNEQTFRGGGVSYGKSSCSQRPMDHALCVYCSCWHVALPVRARSIMEFLLVA
ncbi:hypothetical protein IQ07DRAFT_27823 [Pyrenochaeta sp. DS3sAY3a]|nr:hypothetical protein IQ07DRAFT_27823 [Pyrenochaeta sp. DS3sAY3a]